MYNDANDFSFVYNLCARFLQTVWVC